MCYVMAMGQILLVCVGSTVLSNATRTYDTRNCMP